MSVFAIQAFSYQTFGNNMQHLNEAEITAVSAGSNELHKAIALGATTGCFLGIMIGTSLGSNFAERIIYACSGAAVGCYLGTSAAVTYDEPELIIYGEKSE